MDAVADPIRCPYGQPGDLLWVRERLEWESYAGSQDLWYEADSDCVDADPPANWSPPFLSATEHWEEGDNIPGGGFVYWTGIVYSSHMPRWASRITLRLTDVRVERVQDMSADDAMAEGIWPEAPGLVWDAINAKRGHGWDTNPWVWALTFDVIQKNVDEVLADAFACAVRDRHVAGV